MACAADVGSYESLPNMDSQHTSVIKNRRGRKLYRWRTDKLEVKGKQQEFQQEMAKNAVRFSELLESIGKIENNMERECKSEDYGRMGAINQDRSK